MVHILILIAGVSMYLHDALVPGAIGPEWLAGITVPVCLLACWLTAAAVIGWCGKRLDRTGSYRAVVRAERAAAWARLGATGVFVLGVLGLGWLGAVRELVGDRIVLDEMVAFAPLVGVFALTWWSLYPIERRLREAALLRELDEGVPVAAIVPRRAYVANAVRHQMLIVLVPLLMVMTWAEVVDWLATVGPAWSQRFLGTPAGYGAATIAGVTGLFVLSPAVLRWIWRTTPLGEGPILDRIRSMCVRHRVRVQRILVWWTHGTLTNAAVMGIWGRIRYVLLSDALLDHLEADQVEAVAAHEVAHVRRRHIPWLAATILSMITVASVPMGWLVEVTMGVEAANGWAGATAALLAIAAAFWAFGFASRRFEWQADAFAAQHMSGWSFKDRRARKDLPITQEAAEAMVGALERVARLNGAAVHRHGWRHGSIAHRQARLRGLVGQSAGRLAIDRQVAKLKAGVVVLLVLAAGLVYVDVQRAERAMAAARQAP